MSDSGLMINLSFSNNDVRNKTPAGERNRKDRSRNKQFLGRRRFQKGQTKHNQKMDQQRQTPPLQNRAVTQHTKRPTLMHNTSDPDTDSMPSTSTHSQNRGGAHCASSSQEPTTTSASTGIPSKCLAIDCEMVGTGPKGSIGRLARCSLVSYEGDVVYDKFIKPSVPVTDYRTRWSGIRHRDLVNAVPHVQARKEILKLLMGRVVIGHAIHNDFKALGYTHPAVLTRDTSRIPLLNAKAGFAEKEVASLKRLTKALFNQDIQTGKKGHSSVEDARATMRLYRLVEVEWERELASRAQAC
ncbi:interferon-stimulated 20 kDa exonuclease-like 2 [Antennarius striatus]|uniref:interferon-stimulated 20 kDa exonuclease-like 2 n=1 Tax=Antennarius striatus TaxID=241820 RepID=UPI0035B3D474